MEGNFHHLKGIKMKISIYLSIFLSLSGCGIGGHWMTGDPSAGKNVKPYGAHWVKEGMTREARKNDWIQCGGAQGLNDGYERTSNISNKDFFDGLNLHRKKIRSCMDGKGYRWKEQCDASCLYP
jgi:hypothetical protein